MLNMNVAPIQMSYGIDRRENIQKAVKLVHEAADKSADMVCLQKLYAGRYFPQTVDVRHYDLASPLPDDSVKTMQRIASEKK
jgi:N-carbamoylputrescine amidase